MRFSELPWQELAGLRPQARACVGQGFSREEVKEALLKQGLGFTAQAVTTPQDLCLEILEATPSGRSSRERILGSASRQEIIRLLLAEPRISSRLPELRALKRGGAFFRRLDEAIQSGRMAFAHADEERVLHERLDERLGSRALRTEVGILAGAYDAWLEAMNYLDPPMAMRRAIEALAGGEGVSALGPRIYRMSCSQPESLEAGFWERLSGLTEVVSVGPGAEGDGRSSTTWTWERWHTIDDGAERLALTPIDFSRDVVLIPDTGEARRSLGRAFSEQGVPLSDPRDPTRLRWEEGLKWALLPLQTVTSRYDRLKVISYLRGFEFNDSSGAARPNWSQWIEEINARGIRNGLGSYSGGILAEVSPLLKTLEASFSGRRTVDEFGRAHIEFLRSAGAARLSWLLPLIEALWEGLGADARRVGKEGRRAPLLFWTERLAQRIADMPAPVERLKPEAGVRLYRLYQASPFPAERVFILGAPADWLNSESTGNYWLSERERETLSGEFAIRSRIQARAERLSILKSWTEEAREVVVLDAAYAPDGRERESILPLLTELGCELKDPEEKGSHPRWVASYQALRPVQPQRVLLPRWEAAELSATALDNYSRCGLQSLARDRWRLKDIREPDHDPWPEARGTILHEAVRIFLASRDSEGVYAVSEEESLMRAWETHRPKGLLRGDRVRRLSQARMIEWLRTFRSKEQDYWERARTRVLSLEDRKFRLDLGDCALVGKPDRIDEHPEGLFVVDYKTSSDLPSGTEMIELGYRLQLPFYALAVEKELGAPVIGMQFIELSRKGGRSHGIFLKQYNGKQPGKLTATTANSRSLVAEPRDEIWRKLEAQIRSHVTGFRAGVFAAEPKRQEKECIGCFAQDLCGRRRLIEDLSEESEGGPAA